MVHSPVHRMLESVDGFIVYAEFIGDVQKPGLVFVHGFGGTSAVFDSIFMDERLLCDFCMARYDMRGFGRSSKPRTPDELSPFLIARDFAAVIDAFGFSNVIVVAWSLGGTITSDIFAHLDPCPVRAIAYLCASPHLPEESTKKFLRPITVKLNSVIADDDALAKTYSAAVGQFVDSFFTDPSSVEFTTKTSWIGQVICQPPSVAKMVLQRVQDSTKLLEAGRAGLPVLNIVAARDKLIDGLTLLEEMRSFFSTVEEIVLDAGHALHYEKLDDVVDALLNFGRRALAPIS